VAPHHPFFLSPARKKKMEKDASSYDNSSLNAFFARLEDVLRSALSAFFDQTPGLGEKSTDVRTMLNVLHLKWDDSAGTGKSPASAVVHLEGSPVVAAHFKFIKTLLNRFHHSRTLCVASFSRFSFSSLAFVLYSPDNASFFLIYEPLWGDDLEKTNWELIKQGRDSAVCVLGALHDYANIDTLKARESLLVLWRAAKADRVGDYAYDSEPKVPHVTRLSTTSITPIHHLTPARLWSKAGRLAPSVLELGGLGCC
jgi:hypothetical protein